MRVMLLCSLFTLVASNANAQSNLVPNFSFETTTCCPTQGNELFNSSNCVPTWFSPTSGTPDYFNLCSPSLSVPNTTIGYQNAKTGGAFAGVAVHENPNVREYIEIQLSSPLVSGKDYCVEFYVCLAEYSGMAADMIGAYISSSMVQQPTNFNLPYIPQISNQAGNHLLDTMNWVLISGTYSATGGEQYITIGNFYDDASTSTVSLGIGPISYYFVDDVSVVDCGWTGLEEESYADLISVFPNPSANQTNISYTLKDDGEFILQDELGRIVLKQPIHKGKEAHLTFDVSSLAEGMYFCNVIEGRIVRKSEKLSILR